MTRAEGSKGTRGGEAPVPQTGGGGGDLHLPPSAVRASRSLHNGNSLMGVSLFIKLKHSNTTLTQQARYHNCFRCLKNPPDGKIYI